jgi:pSer/pThr/pTyr-binding forkhead associated (FHA) protein
VNPDVSPELEDAVMRALKREPSARYPTMRALVEDLRRLLDSPRVSAEEEEEGSESSSITMRLMEPQTFAGPKLIVSSSGVALPIPSKDEILIGRADPNIQSKPDIDLETYGGVSAGVSRRHARLLRRPDGWFLEDLHSTNGTFLNDVRLPPGQPVQVHGDDRIALGALSLIFTKE